MNVFFTKLFLGLTWTSMDLIFPSLSSADIFSLSKTNCCNSSTFWICSLGFLEIFYDATDDPVLHVSSQEAAMPSKERGNLTHL